MRNIGFRLFLIIIMVGFVALNAIPWLSYGVQLPYTGGDYKLGLDLKGGIELDYKVDLEEARKDESFDALKENKTVESLKKIVDNRISGLGINDSVITTANYGNEKHIIVQIPLKGESLEESKENIEKAKETIGKVVKLEFKERKTEITDEDLLERKLIADKLLGEAKNSQYEYKVTGQKFRDSYENVDFGTIKQTKEELKTNLGIEKIDLGIYKEVVKTNKDFSTLSVLEKQILAISGEGYMILNVTKIDGENVTLEYNFVNALASEWKPAVDSKGRILNDKYFTTATVTANQANVPQVQIAFNQEGAEIFGELTERLIGQQIAIFVGGELITAPTVQAKIGDGIAVITGNYTREEAGELATDINTGVIPAPIYLIAERSIDARLGADSLNKLITSGSLGLLLIFVFLAIVYRLAGVMAGIALVVYAGLVLAIVKLSGGILTLASVAGLILSIGMAIDANILIFERIKEELAKGKEIKKATLKGFEKSWTAIWDANITGLIIALILFVFGVNMIKGFGLMLAIGTVVSLFTVMWVSRVLIFTIAKKEGLSLTKYIGIKK